MKHYTEFLPKDLALKLQDAGMKIEWEDNSPDEHPNTEVNCLTTYADCFDWLWDNGIYIDLCTCGLVDAEKRIYHYQWSLFHTGKFVFSPVGGKITSTWHSAANTAIEHAIKLLEERK